MLSINQLLGIKGRMLLAAETAERVANNQGEPVPLEEEEYQMVMSSLLSLKSDTRAVLAELDILRGMVTGSYEHLFLKEETENDDSGNDVERVEPQESERSGTGEPPEDTGTDEPVRPSGTNRKKSSRPKPRRNTRKSKADS
jgi:hypothetical protein